MFFCASAAFRVVRTVASRLFCSADSPSSFSGNSGKISNPSLISLVSASVRLAESLSSSCLISLATLAFRSAGRSFGSSGLAVVEVQEIDATKTRTAIKVNRVNMIRISEERGFLHDLIALYVSVREQFEDRGNGC